MKRKREKDCDIGADNRVRNAPGREQAIDEEAEELKVREGLPNWIVGRVPLMILESIAEELAQLETDGLSAYSHLVTFVSLGTNLIAAAPDLEYQRLKDPRRSGLLIATLWVSESMRSGRDFLILQSPLQFATIVDERLTRYIETTYRCASLMQAVPTEKLIDKAGELRVGPWTQVARELQWRITDVHNAVLLMEPQEQPESPGVIALTRDHRIVLSFLTQRIPNCLQVNEIVTHCGIGDRETVGRLLRELETMRLVHRPYGERKGYIPTPTGAKVIGFKSES